MTDLANNAAAVAAGWTRIQIDRGAGKSPRYISRYEKPITGEFGESGFAISHQGQGSDVDQATADANALASLNGFRVQRYGSGATANHGTKGGPDHTADST